MARLAFTFAVLFFLFTFSGAHFQVHSTENDVTYKDDSSKSMPVADSDPTILLPTEKSDQSADESASGEVEAIDVNDLVHVTLPEPTTAFVSFHPINRHFRTNRQFPLRYTRRRPCRHSVRPMNHRSRDISYGNDMILSKNGRDPELLFRDQIIPSMALKFRRENHHHGYHQNEFISNYALARDKVKRPFNREEERENGEFISNYALARDKFKRPLRREEEERENEGRENGGFVKRFRKFLNNF